MEKKPWEIEVHSWCDVTHFHTEDADGVTDHGAVKSGEVITASDGTEYTVKITLERKNDNRSIFQVADDDKDIAYYAPHKTLVEFYSKVKAGEKVNLYDDLIDQPHVERTIGVEDADYWIDPCEIQASVLEWGIDE